MAMLVMHPAQDFEVISSPTTTQDLQNDTCIDSSIPRTIILCKQLRSTLQSLQYFQHLCSIERRCAKTVQIRAILMQIMCSLLSFESIFKRSIVPAVDPSSRLSQDWEALVKTLSDFRDYCEYDVMSEMDSLSETLICLSLTKFGKRVIGDVNVLADSLALAAEVSTDTQPST